MSAAPAEFQPQRRVPADQDRGLKAGWSLLSILSGIRAAAMNGNLVGQSRRLPSGTILVTETLGP